MNAFRVSVASSAPWLSDCWTLRKTRSCKLGSWSARLLCRMVSCRRRPDESPVDHWRRRHRTGHTLAEQFGLDLLSVAETSHRWSCGEAKARLLGPQNAHDSSVTRRQHTPDWKTKRCGVHSKRFNVWRWETPLESFCGWVLREPHAKAISVGWLQSA